MTRRPQMVNDMFMLYVLTVSLCVPIVCVDVVVEPVTEVGHS